MAEIALLATTGNEPIDRALHGIVGAYEAAFPGRVRGYYLLGSYAEGNAVAVSDIDANALFADAFVDAAERDRAEALRRACDALSPVRLDLLVRDERSLHPLDVRLARSAVLLYGEDTRARLPLPDRLTYRRQVTEAPLHFVVKHLRGGPPVAFPLDYPDAGDRLLGYDPPGLAAYFYPPSTPGGTKTLVVTACWIATATVALATGRMVGGKSEAVRAYREDIGDEWSGFLEQLHERCRGHWGYRVPADPAGAAELEELCRRMLAFENRYLEGHRAFVLDQLRGAEGEARLFGARRLEWVVYRDDEVRAALDQVSDDPEEEVRSAARRALVLVRDGPA